VLCFEIEEEGGQTTRSRLSYDPAILDPYSLVDSKCIL
jgi:hypothetical protein